MSVKTEVQSWPIENVVPYEKNAKIHDPAQIKKIARSIKEFGWDQPIVVDKNGVIIKGHGRHLAALQLGMKRVPVIVRDDLTPEQVRAARLADNRVAQGDMDTEILQEELAALADLDVDLEALGFDEREYRFLTEELDDLNEEVLIDDLETEVAEHTEELEKKASSASERLVPIVEVFGFKAFTVDQARAVNKLVAYIESETGSKGAEALSKYAERIASAW